MDVIDFSRKIVEAINASPGLVGQSPIPQTQIVNYPWIDPPNGYLSFDEVSTIALPATLNVDTQVLAYQIPQGWEGVIKFYSCSFDGTGFAEGSGDIVWKLNVNTQPMRGFNNITVSRGNNITQRLLSGGLRVFSNDTVYWYVNHVANAGINGVVTCSITGHIWPTNQAAG